MKQDNPQQADVAYAAGLFDGEEVMWKWEHRAAAETKWSDCPFDEKKTRTDAIVRSAGMTQPAESSRNGLTLERE